MYSLYTSRFAEGGLKRTHSVKGMFISEDRIYIPPPPPSPPPPPPAPPPRGGGIQKPLSQFWHQVVVSKIISRRCWCIDSAERSARAGQRAQLPRSPAGIEQIIKPKP